MQDSLSHGTSLWTLVKGVAYDGKLLVKEEVQLAKTEMTEKISQFGRKAAPVAIGAFLAYAGLIALLLGMGLLGAFGLQQAGLAPLLAGAAGLGGVGLLTAAMGALFIRQRLKAFSKESLKPEKTVETLQNLKDLPPGAKAVPAPEPEPEDTRNSQEIKQSVLATEARLANSLDELERRLTFSDIREHAREGIQTHPYRWGLVAMGTGLAGSLLFKRPPKPGFLKWTAFAVRALLPLFSPKKHRNGLLI
jgi:Putative Actinobacterial Holin-X, holin superfamily III